MKYSVNFLFRDERGNIQRKNFDFDTEQLSLSPYEIFRWAKIFNAEKIIFNKKEKNNGKNASGK